MDTLSHTTTSKPMSGESFEFSHRIAREFVYSLYKFKLLSISAVYAKLYEVSNKLHSKWVDSIIVFNKEK